MNLADLATMLDIRLPVPGRTRRVLDRCHTISDLQRKAVRFWPAAVRDFVEGGAEGEQTLRGNPDAFGRYCFLARVLRDISAIDTSCTLIGTQLPVPFALAPTGATRIAHQDGEVAVARAASRAGVPYTLATMSTTAIRDVAAVCDRNLWFQLYVWRDRNLVEHLLAHALGSNCQTLLVTVDTPVSGLRHRDVRNGFTLPPRVRPGVAWNMMRHAWWCAGLIAAPPIRFENLTEETATRSRSVMEVAAQQFDASLTWRHLRSIREQWPGRLVIKGIVAPDDASRAVDVGADAIVLSNHGGRQLDRAVSPLAVLPAVREVIGDRLEKLLDSGIRRGADIAIALALGADGSRRTSIFVRTRGGRRGWCHRGDFHPVRRTAPVHGAHRSVVDNAVAIRGW